MQVGRHHGFGFNVFICVSFGLNLGFEGVFSPGVLAGTGTSLTAFLSYTHGNFASPEKRMGPGIASIFI